MDVKSKCTLADGAGHRLPPSQEDGSVAEQMSGLVLAGPRVGAHEGAARGCERTGGSVARRAMTRVRSIASRTRRGVLVRVVLFRTRALCSLAVWSPAASSLCQPGALGPVPRLFPLLARTPLRASYRVARLRHPHVATTTASAAAPTRRAGRS
ncbi:hypothetical protein OH76DRAFT_1104661 [Lentinus brumalis]|uniref:Uncharacterized protein n=1 Tax=Lentinus brumalis TaxID=2498619 RepID=A0A371CVF5_9APHY|nr:hypothetical protein OH76DRAFT_1104661 [Polyporus brumalis]